MKEKIKQFKELVDCYQDKDKADCIKNRLLAFENEFKTMRDEIALEKAESLSKDFTSFYRDFFNYYGSFFNEYHKEDCEDNEYYKEYVDYAKIYLESCSLNILKLNAWYIQPITNKVTIEKANRSIYWGKWSVGLGWGSILIGLAATIISLCFSIDSDKTIKGLKQDLLKQESMLNDNNKFVKAIDSVVNVNNVNLSKLIEQAPDGSNSDKKSNTIK